MEQLRIMQVAEVVAIALAIHRKRAKEGKTSKRVVVRLKPSLIPPEDGNYETGIGRVRLKSFFKADQGCWYVEVKLPDTEGFRLKDHIGNPPSASQFQQPDSSQ
jgi:hypothetical protein